MPNLADSIMNCEKRKTNESDNEDTETVHAKRKATTSLNRKTPSDDTKSHSKEAYAKRVKDLNEKLSDVDLSKLVITSEDLHDPYCDPENPKKLNFNDISAAAYRIKGKIVNTSCGRSHLSDITEMELFFKKDFLQYTGSFKDRGARYCLLSLSEKQKQIGVIAASAGNHAQALCYHGKQLSIPVVCVMPMIAPLMKVNNCKKYGAIVLMYGNDLGEAKNVAMKLGKMFELMYINGYDHPDILAGQGTMALEIMEQCANIDAIVVPTGGAGLLAGIAVAVKTVNPKIKIIAVESEKCPSFKNAVDNGSPILTKPGSTLADGLAVSTVGVNAFATVSKLIDKCVVVREEFIAIAILRLIETEKAVVEGAGACGLAAILEGLLSELKGKRVVIPLCGGNIDSTVLGRVLERGLVADSRLIKFWVVISDRPGGLVELCRIIFEKKASVKDMFHERGWLKSDMFSVQVQVVLEVRDAEHAKELEMELRKRYDTVAFAQYGTAEHKHLA